jgi:hypothetical protein
VDFTTGVERIPQFPSQGAGDAERGKWSGFLPVADAGFWRTSPGEIQSGVAANALPPAGQKPGRGLGATMLQVVLREPFELAGVELGFIEVSNQAAGFA